jgi:hypothetical protein
MWTHVDEDEVIPSVIQLLGESKSDGDASATTAEDHHVICWREGRHGRRIG